MQAKFSPSINIVRDFKSEINYIPTPNADQIYQRILSDYKLGTHSFNIVGSYGTGKSAFLWAFEKHLNREKEYFAALNGHFGDIQKFHFVNIVGEYASLVDSIGKHFGIVENLFDSQLIIEAIDQLYQQSAAENIGLAIVIDEFGKFLEYASANDPERELYLVQQLAEYANDSSKNIILITVLHQNFDAYSKSLKKEQRQEWEKVKGRLREVSFNEPVEQLLFLAATRISDKKFVHPPNFQPKLLIDAIEDAKVFPLRTSLTEELAKKLYPFDVLAAGILTKALQEYGQNERSLFTFLESDDYLGLNHFQNKKEAYYNLRYVYDYLIYNYSSLLTTKYNHHFFQWRAIQHAIDRVEATFEKFSYKATQLVKVIGLLNIFALAGSRIDKKFLTAYALYSLGIPDADEIIGMLEIKKIIRFLNYKDQYILFEGTDLDIEVEIERAAKDVEDISDIVTRLRSHFSFPYLTAKAVHYKYGTPRFFRFHFSDVPIDTPPKGQVDGVINLIFSDQLTRDDILEHSKKVDEAILYGFYRNTEQIRGILREIDKIQYVIEKRVDDRVAERELRNILEFRKQELDQCVLSNLYQNSGEVVWIFQGKIIPINSRGRFTILLSEICESIYPQTPVFKNELINREKLPSVISKARKNLFAALTEHWDQADLGFQKNEFPPEKTIYLSLLRNTGIHREKDGVYSLGEPAEPSFKILWDASENFLTNAKITKKNLAEFVETLSAKPLKLKRGLIDFWIPIFLFIKREDYALFGEEGFIPTVNTDTLDLIIKSPQKFQVKSFALQGVKLDLFNKYRSFLNQSLDKNPTTLSFIETIKPFLSFYRGLPEYAKKTKRLSHSVLNLRDAIVSSTDPEKTFFEDFPNALGYTQLNLYESPGALADYILQLQNSIRELRTCFDALLNRFENHLLNATGYEGFAFGEYQAAIHQRYETLKLPLLLPHQKVFYRQLMSQLDERTPWLRAVIQSLLGKPVEKMRDEEEELIIEKMSITIRELDNLCDIAKMEIDEAKEEIVKVELTMPQIGSKFQLVRIARHQEADIQKLKHRIQKQLGNNKNINIAVLLKLLQEALPEPEKKDTDE